MAMGIPYEKVGDMNPHILDIHYKAYKRKMQDTNWLLHLLGMYFAESISATVCNQWRGKGEKPYKYPDKPYEIFKSEQKDLTDAEIRMGNEALFAQLKIMQMNFNNHKAKEKETNNGS